MKGPMGGGQRFAGILGNFLGAGASLGGLTVYGRSYRALLVSRQCSSALGKSTLRRAEDRVEDFITRWLSNFTSQLRIEVHDSNS